MEKNVAGQTWVVFAFDRTDNVPKTGDAAQITANLRIDGAAANDVDDLHPTELEDGYYVFDITQVESNGNTILITPVSSTGNIQVIGCPAVIHTSPENFNDLGIEADGDIAQVTDIANQVTADVTAISGDSTAADNLESQYDETGLSGDTYPATQSQMSNITNVGSATNTQMTDYTLTTGTQSANTKEDTVSLDGVKHTHTSTGDAMVLEYEFHVGAGIPSSVQITGALTGGNDDLEVLAYDYVSAGYVQIGVLNGKVSSDNAVYSYDLFTSMVGTGASIGEVKIKFQDGAYTLSTATLYIDQIFVSFSSASGSYNGRIWVDDSVSNTHTVPEMDGIDTNPVSTWAAALTLSTKTNINKFQVANGTAITLSGNSDAFSLYGENYSLALGGRSIEGLYIEGPSALVTGVGTATVTPPSFKNCKFGTVTLPPCGMLDCGFAGHMTGGSAGQYVIKGGFSLVAGTGSPEFTFTGLGSATGINARGWTGGAKYNLDSDCTASHEVLAGGKTQMVSNAAIVEIRGITRELDFDLTGAGTLQFIGITGLINISGTTTATLNLHGVSTSITDTSVTATVNDYTQNSTDQAAILADVTGLNGDVMRGTDGVSLVVPDAAGTAATPAEVATALTTYDAPTRAEATSDKDEIIVEIDANETKIDTMQGNVTDILEDTGTTLPGLIAALNNLTATEVKTAMEADGGDLSSIIEALVNKLLITEATGDAEMHNDSGASQGTVSGAFTSIAGVTKRERMFK